MQIPIMVCVLLLSVLGLFNTKMILTGVFGTLSEVVPVKEPLGGPGGDSTACPSQSHTLGILSRQQARNLDFVSNVYS